MPIGGGLIGRLFAHNVAGEANENAGATPNYDDDGNIVNYTSADGSTLTKEQVKKTGTGALKRPSLGISLFAPQAADRINSINTQFAAIPAEDQQRYSLERGHLEDVIGKGYQQATGKELDPTQKQMWAAAIGTRALASGFSAGDIANQLEKASELKEGGPQALGELEATKSKSGLEQEKAFRAAQGPSLLGSAQAKQAGLSGQLASGELSRMPITQQILDSDALNRLTESTGLTPKKIQYEAQDLAYRLGRMPTENEVESQALKNRLWQEQNITPLQLSTEAGRTQTANELLPATQQIMRNTAASNLLSSAQPPDINRLSLYTPQLSALQAGDLRHGYKSIGINPFIQTPMMMQMEMAKRLGGQSSGNGFMKLPSGEIIGPQTKTSAPITAPIQANIPPISVGAGGPIQDNPPAPMIRPTVAQPYDVGSAAGAPNNSGMWNDYLQRLKWGLFGGWSQQRQDAINP